MPSDFEMEDSDSSNESLNIDPSTLASVTQGRPRVSAECERVFSSTKKLITPERNRLSEESIETSERLKNWCDRVLIMQQEDAEVIHEGYDIESKSGL